MNTTNPFPGMNPFMEQTWPDVHLAMIGFVREALGIELPEDLVAKAEQQVDVFETPHGASRPIRPDLAIVDVSESWEKGLPPVWTPGADAGAITVAEPALIMASEIPRRWIEIRTDLGDLVTVIEVLSPANKFTHRNAYCLKRHDYVAAGVNVVEIDLLRGGLFTVDVDETTYEQLYGPLGERYTLCASRGIVRGRREVYPCPLRERLPAIRIPLRATDPDVPLDIQALVDRCYTTGRYWKLDYTRTLWPALAEADAAWVAGRLVAAGLRS